MREYATYLIHIGLVKEITVYDPLLDAAGKVDRLPYPAPGGCDWCNHKEYLYIGTTEKILVKPITTI
jgi:hypothetical protein